MDALRAEADSISALIDLTKKDIQLLAQVPPDSSESFVKGKAHSKVVVYSEPSSRSVPIDTLNVGDEVDLVSVVEGYIKGRSSKGVGYFFSSAVRIDDASYDWLKEHLGSESAFALVESRLRVMSDKQSGYANELFLRLRKYEGLILWVETSSARDKTDITYSVGSTTEQAKSYGSPWRRLERYAKPGDFVTLSAQRGAESGGVFVEMLYNGAQIDYASSRGEFVIASASGSIPKN